MVDDVRERSLEEALADAIAAVLPKIIIRELEKKDDQPREPEQGAN